MILAQSPRGSSREPREQPGGAPSGSSWLLLALLGSSWLLLLLLLLALLGSSWLLLGARRSQEEPRKARRSQQEPSGASRSSRENCEEQNEGQEDKGEAEVLGGTLPSCFPVQWSSWPGSGRGERAWGDPPGLLGFPGPLAFLFYFFCFLFFFFGPLAFPGTPSN